MENIELDIVIQPEIHGRRKIFSINSVQIPNVVTQGKTLEEAKSRLREALSLYFEEAPEEKARLMNFKRNVPLISRMLL